MNRSHSFSVGVPFGGSGIDSTASRRRTLFPHRTGTSHRHNTSSTNAIAATAAGRALLHRPRERHAPASPFTASAADSPIPRVVTEPSLKSCLSNSDFSSADSTKSNGSATTTDSNTYGPNEVFKLKRNVSFSHLQIREYEVTLGCNPSVKSGAPLSLGWKYDPEETLCSLDAFEAVKGRRPPKNQLILTDRERHDRLKWHCPEEYDDNLYDVMQDIAETRLERKQSRNELAFAAKTRNARW